MKIFGVDFTSTPKRSKPITVAETELNGETLKIIEGQCLTSAQDFEGFLRTSGQWIAAIDFPFGQPRKLVTASHWPLNWPGYVETVSLMSKLEFENYIRAYRDPETGKSRLFRNADIKARSRSPMQLDFIPVGKMFFFGAPLLLRSRCTIVPFRNGPSEAGIIVEGYPKLVAEKAVGTIRYKSETHSPNNLGLYEVRRSILEWLASQEALNIYGFKVKMGDPLFTGCLDDNKGDKLDAVLCAVQAAWAWTKRQDRFGVPEDCDLIEGWIIDPSMVAI